MMKAVGLFLLLLKALGWALLALLLVLLALLLFVLFVPVRYDALVENGRSMEPGQRSPIASLRVQLKVDWLLHLLHICVHYGPGGIENDIRVAGIDIIKALAWLSRKKETKKQEKRKKEAKKKRIKTKKHTRPAKETASSSTGSGKTAESMEVHSNAVENQASEKGSETREQRSEKGSGISPESESQGQSFEKGAEIGAEPGSQEQFLKKGSGFGTADAGRNLGKKLQSQLHRIHTEISSEVNRHAVSHLWKELLKLLKSYRPRKLKVDVAFSLANPALTGGAVGILSLMPWIYRYPCSVIPDFTSDRLYIEGEILAKGRVSICVFLLSLLRMLRDKEFMQAFRRLMEWDRA